MGIPVTLRAGRHPSTNETTFKGRGEGQIPPCGPPAHVTGHLHLSVHVAMAGSTIKSAVSRHTT